MGFGLGVDREDRGTGAQGVSLGAGGEKARTGAKSNCAPATVTVTVGYVNEQLFPTTEYFRAVRARADRAMIKDEWILQAIERPLKEFIQRDGRLRRWTRVQEAGGRPLRVVLLPDRRTVHNAFFDRTFSP